MDDKERLERLADMYSGYEDEEETEDAPRFVLPDRYSVLPNVSDPAYSLELEKRIAGIETAAKNNSVSSRSVITVINGSKIETPTMAYISQLEKKLRDHENEIKKLSHALTTTKSYINRLETKMSNMKDNLQHQIDGKISERDF